MQYRVSLKPPDIFQSNKKSFFSSKNSPLRCPNLIIVLGHGPRYQAQNWVLANITLYNPAPAPHGRISRLCLTDEHTEELRINSRLSISHFTSAASSPRYPCLGAARPSCVCSPTLRSHSAGQGRKLCSRSQDESSPQLVLGTLTDTEKAWWLLLGRHKECQNHSLSVLTLKAVLDISEFLGQLPRGPSFALCFEGLSLSLPFPHSSAQVPPHMKLPTVAVWVKMAPMGPEGVVL